MTDPAFEAWKRRAADADILDVAVNTLGAKLKRHAREHIGACPLGCSERDGFSVNTSKRVFNCRKAGAGGDVIAMVMHVRGVSFMPACEIIVGEAPPAKGTQLTAEALAAAEIQKEGMRARAAKRATDDNLYRASARRSAFDIFERGHALADLRRPTIWRAAASRFPQRRKGAPSGSNASSRCRTFAAAAISPRCCIAGRQWCCRSSTPSASLPRLASDLSRPDHSRKESCSSPIPSGWALSSTRKNRAAQSSATMSS
jgi:hypothetical protein